MQLAGLRAALSVFERRYLELVGARYAELDEIEAQIAEQLARNNPSDHEAENKAREARSDARSSHEAASSVGHERLTEFTPSLNLKALYREVAKTIHPDLTTDPIKRVRRQTLMAEANAAYERGDEARLRKILEEYECSPEVVQSEGTGAELVRVIRKIAQIKKRVAEINTGTEQLKQSELYELKARVEEAEKQGRGLLNEMADMVEGQITSARERLRQASRS